MLPLIANSVLACLLCLAVTTACGNSDIARWTNLEVRASDLAAQGRYAEAAVPAREAVVLAEELFGPESPTLAASLNNLGVILRDQGDAQGAEEASLRALAVAEAAFPLDHEFVATTRTNLERLYSEQGRIAEMAPV